jgi:arylsulfatase A-like enzyme
VCVPARISFFSGQYPHQHGQWGNSDLIRTETKMFIEHLKSAGYHTGAIGKLHFNPLGKNRRRFDSSLVHGENEYSDYLNQLSEISPDLASDKKQGRPLEGDNGEVYGTDSLRDDKRVLSIVYGTSQVPLKHFYTQWLSDESIRYLEAHCNEPFFLFASFYGPHSPFMLPEPYKSMYDPDDVVLPDTLHEELSCKPLQQLWHSKEWGMNGEITDQQMREVTALYYGHITLIDKHIGRILDKLDDLGVADNTIIAFSADHGELLGAHAMIYKDFMYDESMRIPLLICDAGQQKQAVYDSFISQIDIMPTLLDLAGVEVPEWSCGMSAKGVLEGKKKAIRDGVFAEIDMPCENGSTGHRIGYRNRNHLFSYEVNPETDEAEGELYDLTQDPLQINNLFSRPEYENLVIEYKGKILHLLMDV